MAERRMFAKTIIDSDAFIDMPVTARLLYYDLAMRADDDGFVNAPKKIMRMVGASQDDLSILILRKFILPFDNGVVVIKHWRIHNYIRKDTYSETPYTEQKALLELDENKAYRFRENEPSTSRQRVVDEPWTQVRLDQVSLGKANNIESERAREEVRKAYGIYNNVRLTDAEMQSLRDNYPDEYEQMIENLSEYMKCKGKFYSDHYATLMKWKREDEKKAPKKKDELQEFYDMVDEMVRQRQETADET